MGYRTRGDDPYMAIENPPHKDEVIQEITWEQFQSYGMFWFINRILHTFGLVIIREIDDETGTLRVYPARTVWRGFPPETEELGFQKVTAYLKDNAIELHKETLER